VNVEHAAGGVCVFVNKSLHSVELKRTEIISDIELTMFDLLFKSSRYRFVLVYRKPIYGNAGTRAAQSLVNLLDKYSNDHHGPTFVLGDLNCPRINWSVSSSSRSMNAETIIEQYVSGNGFTQCITEATRVNNILDVLCTDEPVLISEACVGPAFSNSDHNTILFTIDMPSDGLLCDNRPSIGKKCIW